MVTPFLLQWRDFGSTFRSSVMHLRMVDGSWRPGYPQLKAMCAFTKIVLDIYIWKAGTLRGGFGLIFFLVDNYFNENICSIQII